MKINWLNLSTLTVAFTPAVFAFWYIIKSLAMLLESKSVEKKLNNPYREEVRKDIDCGLHKAKRKLFLFVCALTAAILLKPDFGTCPESLTASYMFACAFVFGIFAISAYSLSETELDRRQDHGFRK